jgi:putative hemolysin
MYVNPNDLAGPFPAQEDAADISGIPPEIALIILVLGVLLYATVNAVEIAIAGVNRLRMRALAEEGSIAAKSVLSLLETQERFFAFIVLLQNIGVVLASTMGGFLAAELIGGVTGVIVGTIVLTLGIALFGEITPKVLAAHSGERFPLRVAPIVNLLMTLLRPLVVVLAAAPSLLSRLMFGEEAGKGHAVSEMELRMLIDIGAEEGSVEEAEAELLDRVFHFGDRRVNEIMVPRTEVVWLRRDTSVLEFYQVYAEAPHSRFPVYETSHDNVVGIVNIKDVLRGMAEKTLSEQDTIAMAMRPALFMPETKYVGAAFFELQRAGHQMAVVVDEYGGTGGIVTLEMLLEELVGYVSDELRRHEEEFVEVDERTVQLDAGMSVLDANQELNFDLPEGDDYETVAGFVLSRLGRLPEEGEQFTYNGLRIAVVRVDGNRIEEVHITRL